MAPDPPQAPPCRPRDDDGPMFREPAFREPVFREPAFPEPVFREPWEAQAFAMAIALHERGLFTWSEWTATLAHEIRRAQAAGDPDIGSTYFRHWLNALERLIAEKNIASGTALTRHRAAWARAAARTPHGTAIVLADEDFAG